VSPFFPVAPQLLEQLRAPKVLFAFDFDGTLAALEPDRDAPRMRPSTQALFDRLCELAPTAVISGRGRADVLGRLGAAKLQFVAGNHGAELGEEAPFERHRLDAVRAALQALAERTPRLELEDKQFGFALHFQDFHAPEQVAAATAQAIAGLSPELRLVPGVRVLNVVPARAPHKGDTLLALMRRVEATTTLFVGDDVTDEDVFALPPSEGLVTVRIGETADSQARFFLREQEEIEVLLGRLVELRLG
jgi:trehalose 6-phosphate phosphatase